MSHIMANKWPKNGQKMANKNNDQLGLSRAKAAVPLRTVRGSLTETYMALAPRSPSRRSLRVASQYAHDPYPLAPLLADELPPPPTIRSRVFKFVIHLSQLSFAEAFAPLCALPGAGVSGICVVLQFGDCCLVSAVLGLVFLSSTQDPGMFIVRRRGESSSGLQELAAQRTSTWQQLVLNLGVTVTRQLVATRTSTPRS